MNNKVDLVSFEVTEENVDTVHTYLEGSIEVEEDDSLNLEGNERHEALMQALSDSTSQSNVPHTIIVPAWLALELKEEIELDL